MNKPEGKLTQRRRKKSFGSLTTENSHVAGLKMS